MAGAIEEGMRVELRHAPLPWPLGLFASHYWFVVFDGGRAERWEVWQTKRAGGRAIGHLHCDLKPPDAGVGGGPMRVEARWTGEDAQRLRAVLRKASAYPHCERYRYWPGPNSNTYAAWILRQAGIAHRLPRRAVGGGYRG
jgi:hypothetical protein